MTGKMSVLEMILLAVMIVSLIVLVILGSGPAGERCYTLGRVMDNIYSLLIPAAVAILSALAGGWRLSVLSFLGIVFGICFGEWFAIRVEEIAYHEGFAVYCLTAIASILIGIAAEVLWHKLRQKK